MDDNTRDRIIKRMIEDGGAQAIAGQLLAEAAVTDGWNTANANRLIAMLTDREILTESSELLRLAAAGEGFHADTIAVAMVDAVLDTYTQHDIAPLVTWFTIATLDGQLDA